MSKVNELAKMVDFTISQNSGEYVTVSVEFLRDLYTEIRDDEPLTSQNMKRVFGRIEKVVDQLPQIEERMEKLTIEAAAAVREKDDLIKKLEIAERIASKAVVALKAEE